ncbi:MAG TPA: S-methyl-5-thioribose-1-phosphate isomerase, partial [Burkholderiales bacterium]|nr:S-methyl-5-thioribose-1-phosphate isomerase [Burkholderiales bacterium]
FGHVEWAPPQVKTRNPAFDVTPAELVSALITEKGVVETPTAEKIAALFTGEE